ncbi:hypothetical protein N9H34_00250 [bacterium]|nr:hypothetical protein [bacterium]
MRNFVHLTEEQIAPYIKDDPVRPHLSAEFRTRGRNKAFALVEDTEVLAIVCCALTFGVPTEEKDLTSKEGHEMVVSPYTVWSYKKGAGRQIIECLLRFVQQEHQEISKSYWPRIVTLSPKTEMAENFHLKNGAKKIGDNETTNNFEYSL